MPNGLKYPDWLVIKSPDLSRLSATERIIERFRLHTVCQEAHCPNQGECFAHRTATFIILGDVCTRNCTFCAVQTGRPSTPDSGEPGRIAQAVQELGLKYVVITSVTRDDLPDGGAAHFAATVDALKSTNPLLGIEVLIPDFRGSLSALKTVVASQPSVLGHNVETVPRLYQQVHPQANYSRSIELLRIAKSINPNIFTKSGLMLGLGEGKEEVIEVLKDLKRVDCNFLTVGQYLRPSRDHYPIARFVPPEEFEEYKRIGEALGFKSVASAPLVRSSFQADQIFKAARVKGNNQ